MFDGRRLVVATKHTKEKVIAPVFEKELGVVAFVPENFDTDKLGTFTGEIERGNDPLTTARKKCLMAMEVTGCDLAIASEGSFGPHPSLYFVPADDELLFFMDKKNKLEIWIRELSTNTNFNAATIRSEEELIAFAEAVKFPSHGLIVKKSEDDFRGMRKGITEWQVLRNVWRDFFKQVRGAYVETDMRALYNPTRMDVIQAAALKLVHKINTPCPACLTPGFGITEAKKGLACAQCCYPTQSTLSYIRACLKCSFSTEEMHPHGKLTEDPMYCQRCNP